MRYSEGCIANDIEISTSIYVSNHTYTTNDTYHEWYMRIYIYIMNDLWLYIHIYHDISWWIKAYITKGCIYHVASMPIWQTVVQIIIFFSCCLYDLEILWNSRMRLGPLPEQCRSEKLYFRSRDGRNWDAGETWGGLGGGISTWGVAKLGNSETQGESNMGRRKGRIWFGDDDFVELLWAIGPQVFDEVESLFQPDEGSSDENWNG